MQIVLSGNRVIAYGNDCFLAMGGTVVCEETGKSYPNATIAEVKTLPADIGSVGYEYHAGVFIPCAPYGMDNGNGTILVACEECGTPKDSGLRIDEIIGARLIVTAPAGCDVVCTNGDKSVKGIYKNGVYVCNLTDYGTWTVAVSRWHGFTPETASNTVVVDVAKQYYLTFGATIAVTYPENSTLTCTNGDVVLTATEAEAFTFEVLAFGDWELYCTNNSEETSRTVTISEGGQAESVKLAYFAADIDVTYPASSTCTCTDGATTFTDTNETDTEKTVTFTVPNAGTWTVTATDGLQTKSASVSITTEWQSESVTLSYRLYLIENGVVNPTYNFNSQLRSGYPCSSYETDGSVFNIDSAASGAAGGYSNGLATGSKVDISSFSTLNCTLTFTLHGSQQSSLALLSSTEYSSEAALSSGRAYYVSLANHNDSQTVTLDVKNANSSYYIGFVFIKSNANNPQVAISNLWLE